MMVNWILGLLGFAQLSCTLASTITGSATPFVKCEGVSTNDTCIEAVLKEIVVEIGDKGTNDNVNIEICSDIDKKQCCTTPPLKSLLADDWSSNDRETWTDSYFGPCKNKKFLVKRAVELSLSKSKDTPLVVKSLDVYTKNPDKKITELERFQCGPFELGGTKLTKETKQCKTGPYHYEAIEQMVVQMGADGTEDNVSIKICSDSNDLCCENKMTKVKNEDWRASKKQEWLPADFGECKDIKFKTTNGLHFSAIKDGKDPIAVSSVEFYMTQHDSNPLQTTKYACEGFTFDGDCKVASLCTYKFAKCTQTVAPTQSIKKPTFAEVAAGSPTTATTAKTTAKTTTRPPFRSG